MTRAPRNDEPGAWHHVMSRGLARRTMFESDLDIAKFLALLAREVRAARIEIHAFCVLTTHFHLLVRSPRGELSAAMQWVLNQYVRWFNRGRRRDGPLMRSRFISKRAGSPIYRRHLVRYIDFNPVAARLASAPALYPHGSAIRFSRPGSARWLERSWIESVIAERAPGAKLDAVQYANVFGEPLSPGQLRWIERRNQWPRDGRDPLDELLAQATPGVIEWMRRKAALADGTEPGLPVCDAEDVQNMLREERDRLGAWTAGRGRAATDAWELVAVALQRHLCGATLREIAQRTGVCVNTVFRDLDRHRALLESDPEYAERSSELAARAVRNFHASTRTGAVRT